MEETEVQARLHIQRIQELQLKQRFYNLPTQIPLPMHNLLVNH